MCLYLFVKEFHYPSTILMLQFVVSGNMLLTLITQLDIKLSLAGWEQSASYS